MTSGVPLDAQPRPFGLTRRRFLQAGLPALAALGLVARPGRAGAPTDVLKPARLRPGDRVGLVSPASAIWDPMRVRFARERLEALGLDVAEGKHLLDRRGYFAGDDADRAADLNAFFADPDIAGIIALTGGWGAARVLPHLNYDAIAANPKVLCGFSDVTALLIGLYGRTGLVTVHGPNGDSTWTDFSVDFFRRLLFEAERVRYRNPIDDEDDLARTRDRVRTIRPGVARGRLVGGNLTVLTALIGSAYLPDWSGHILFLEDIREDVYRVDRMMTQLKLAGVLDRITGFVFGKCTGCDPDSSYGSLTLPEVLHDHILPLGIPAWSGAMIGHIRDKFSLPLGVEAEIDAESGTIHLLEPAVR